MTRDGAARICDGMNVPLELSDIPRSLEERGNTDSRRNPLWFAGSLHEI